MNKTMNTPVIAGIGPLGTPEMIIIAILVLDFILGIILIHIYRWWWFVPATIL